MRFKGKTIIVTGGAAGFGRGIAERFAAEGGAILVADVRKEAGEETARTLCKQGTSAKFVCCDVSNDQEMAHLADVTVTHFGRIDVFVNNAGVSHRIEPMTEVPLMEFERVFAINVKSIYLSVRHFVPLFEAVGGGCFVNVGSVVATRPRPGATWYAASKAAVITASRAMALELAEKRIRVNVVNPVAGDTGFLNAHGQDSSELRAKFISSIPLGRLALPNDIANAVAFLASDEASLITGACLDVDGGRSI